MFADGSAIIAIIAREGDWESLFQRIGTGDVIYVSAISIREAARGLHYKSEIPLEDAENLVRHLLARVDARTVSIDDQIGRDALRASRLYGRGGAKPH